MSQWFEIQADQWFETQADQWHTKTVEGVLLPAFIASCVCDAEISLCPILPKITATAVCSADIFAYAEITKIQNAIIRYDAILGDLIIPLKLFTATRSAEAGGLSRLDLTTYSYDLLDDINERTDENLSLRKHYEVAGAIVQTDIIMIVNNITVNQSEGRISKTISVSGERSETFISKNVILTESYISKQMQSGKINANYYTIHPEINPGDKMIIDVYDVIVGRISMSFSFSDDGRTVNERMMIVEK